MIAKKEEDVVRRKAAPIKGPKLHRLSVDTYPGRGLIKLNRACSIEPWVQLPGNIGVRHTWDNGPKFPKLDECAHFHYDTVTLGDAFSVNLRTDYGERQTDKQSTTYVTVYYVHVQCKGASWTLTRRYTDAVAFDVQLHRCIFDRRYSNLPELISADDVSDEYTDAFGQLAYYFKRFSVLIQEAIHVKCGSVLNWLEMDNKGNHFLWHVNSGINVPAIAVATVARNYVKREDDELELRIGDLVSIIDMPNVAESPWWRGKHSNRVGFFPSSCVEIIPGSLHNGTVRKQPSKLSLKCDVITTEQETQPDVVKKKRRLKGRLAVLFASRPDRDALRQQGILRGRVFGAHLSEHLYDTNCDVPLIVRVCCRTIETLGIIDGIYRKSGVASNIQRLRQEFDSDNPPSDIINERYLNDIHCVSSLCKMYFRELPDPLLTFQLYDQFADAVSNNAVDVKLGAIRKVVQQLPPYHYSTLGFLTRHLSRVASQCETTGHGMHSRNLALVWAPNLLKPLASESDASAFTEIKIQSVVLQFLIDYANIIFCSEDQLQGTPRLSVCSQVTAGSCTSPPDNMSQTSSVQLVHAAGFRAQRRQQVKRYSQPEPGAPPDEETMSSFSESGATVDVVRSRTTSDITHSQIATRYQYRMKIPLLELAEAQRAHAVSDTDLRPLHGQKSIFRKKDNKKKKLGAIRHSDYTGAGSSSHWARSILNKFSIRRTQSLNRPVISGPCGFVSDPYSTVLMNAQQIIPGVGLENHMEEIQSQSSKLSSVNSVTLRSNVLVLGNVTNADSASLDKSDFVNEWCTDTIRQFLDGKPLSSLQTTSVTDRAQVVPPPRTSPRSDMRRSFSLPQNRRCKKSEDIAFVLRELQDVPSGDNVTESVRRRFNTILGSPSWQQEKSSETSKRTSVNFEEREERPAKHARPLSCPSYNYTENVTSGVIRKSGSFRCSSSNVVLIQQQRSVSFNLFDKTHLMV